MSRCTRRQRQSRISLRDVSYSLRVLLKNYAFTIVVVLTLALGIGANTAIFSFANGILLRPLPYPQSDRLAVIQETALKRGIESMSVSYPNFLDWREQNTVFEGMGTYFGIEQVCPERRRRACLNSRRAHFSMARFETYASRRNSVARSRQMKIVPKKMQW